MDNKPFSVIEFNASTVRVCRSVVRRCKHVVTYCFSFPIAVSWEDFPNEIKVNLKKRGLRLQKAVLMLPRDKAVSRLWVFPSNDPEELGQMVRLRVLKECFGSDKENISYDYKVVGNDKEGCAQVAVFLLQKAQIKRYADLLYKAGIAIEAVTLNTAGLFNWLNFMDALEKKEGGRKVFLLNADDRSFDLQLLSEGKTVFSRSFHIADNAAAQDSLSKELKLSLELCRRQQKDFYDAGAGADFCITGSPDKLLGLDIESWLGKEFRAFDPLEEARSYLDLKGPVNGQSISYAAVLGMALMGSYEGADLTPREIKREKETLAHKVRFRRLFLVSVLFFFLASVVCGFFIERKIGRLHGLRAKIAQSAPLERTLGVLLLDHYLDKEVLRDSGFMNVLERLFEETPSGVTFSSLDINDAGSVNLTGKAQNIELLTGFFSRMKTEKSFVNMKMDFNQSVKESQGAEGIKFRISFTQR